MHFQLYIKHLNTELNPICRLLTLVKTRHILHVSWLRALVISYSLKMAS